MSCVPLQYIDLLVQERKFSTLKVWYQTCPAIATYLNREDKLSLLSGRKEKSFPEALKEYTLEVIKTPQSEELISNLLSLQEGETLQEIACALVGENAMQNYQLLQRHIGTAAYKKRYKDLSILARLGIEMIFCNNTLKGDILLTKYLLAIADKEPVMRALLEGTPRNFLLHASLERIREDVEKKYQRLERKTYSSLKNVLFGVGRHRFTLKFAEVIETLPVAKSKEDWDELAILIPLFLGVGELNTETFLSILRKWPSMPKDFALMLESYENPSFRRAREVVRNLHTY